MSEKKRIEKARQVQNKKKIDEFLNKQLNFEAKRLEK